MPDLTFLYFKNGSPPPTWLLGGVSASISRVLTRNTAHGLTGSRPTHVFVIENGGRAVGWIQWYLWSDYPEHALQLKAELASAGIDLAIGELAMTGLGLGPVAIREFLRQIVFADPSVSGVITDPEERNLRSLRAFKKAGFTLMNTVQLAGENFKRRVVRMDRAKA